MADFLMYMPLSFLVFIFKWSAMDIKGGCICLSEVWQVKKKVLEVFISPQISKKFQNSQWIMLILEKEIKYKIKMSSQDL